MQAEKAQAEMTKAEQWRLIEALFHQALELAPKDRAAFLASACAADPAWRREVESLLATHEAGGSLLETPASDLAAEWSQANRPQSPQPIKLEVIGPYQILSLLGKGGMGEVYLAEDTRLRRKVALKLLPAEFTNRKERLRRFELEARAASATNHPNIITIYEIGRIDTAHFIATEYVEGQTLRRLMNARRLELREVLDVAIQIASALSAAHAAGIRHRDIKPENVMVRPDGLVKVLDFGLAKLAEPPTFLTNADATTVAEANTASGMVVGTVQYMSPEQARGLEVDHRTDIFSLGVVLYELTTGRVPFDGGAIIEVMAAIAHRAHAPLAQVAPGTPARLEKIINHALRKDREQRYQSVTELLSELKDFKQELELEARLERIRPAASRPITPDAAVTTDGQIARIKPVQNSPDKAMQASSSLELLIARIKRQRTGALVALAVLTMAVLAGAFAGFKYFSGAEPRQIQSLAVLPFVNATGDPAVEYLCDGVSESLINRLSPHLKVMSGGATFRYKGRDVDARTVGRDLGVNAVLTGRITKRENDLLILIELVSAEDNRQLWGERYSRRLTSMLGEEEIAQDLSARLRLQLSGEARERLARRYTANTEANYLYLQGRSLWNKRRRDEYGKAIAYFNQAIEKDPAYALAYAGLADCYVMGGGASSGAEAFARAKAAALKALEIDETLAEAHTALAQAKLFHDWNAKAAETEFQRAIALNPNYPTAHQWYAECLTILGRPDEALAQIKLAQALDPDSLSIIRDMGRIYYYTRRYDEAVALCQKVLDRDAGFSPAIVTMGDSLLQKKNYSEAIVRYQKAADLTGGLTLMKSLLAHAYAASGQSEEAQKRLDELRASSKDKPPPAFALAMIHLGLGRKKEALDWLEKARQERYYRLVYIGVDPLFDPLRTEAQFAELQRGIGLAY
jgi:serine/threonine-protein kinase